MLEKVGGGRGGRKQRNSTVTVQHRDSGNHVLNFRHDDRHSCAEGILNFQVGCGLNVGTAWHLK